MVKFGATFVFFLLYSFNSIHCDNLLKGPKCGQIICNRGEYCSSYHLSCEPCSTICNNTTHNYDADLCLKNCQDYLDDARFANLRATVQRLSHMVTVILTLVCLMLVFLVLVLFVQLYRWKTKKNITLKTLKGKLFSKKSDSSPNKTSQIPNQTNSEKPDLRLEIPSDTTHSGINSPMTVSTAISRRPAEDSTLDYAYDNPAMNSSPPGTNNTINNSF